MTRTEPQAWVGCLACYNEGRLTGEWVDGVDAADYVPCERPGHEEWWVMDHEGYGTLIDGECSPQEATDKAEMLAEIDEGNASAFLAYVDVVGEHYATVEGFKDAYAGEYDSPGDCAFQYAEDLGKDFHAWPQSCIDWERAAEELGMSFARSGEGTVFAFRDE
jgi:antirestriction protein